MSDFFASYVNDEQQQNNSQLKKTESNIETGDFEDMIGLPHFGTD